MTSLLKADIRPLGESRFSLTLGSGVAIPDGYELLAIQSDEIGHKLEQTPVRFQHNSIEFRVPESGIAQLSYAGLPLDTIDDLLPTSPAYRQVSQILDPQPVSLNTRPLTPLHKGHIGLLSTAGLLNGVFGSGARLHVAAWKTKKRVIKTEETEDEKITIREREQFVHELAVAFANGETALIE